MAPFLRSLPARATTPDLWAGVDALIVEQEGRARLARRHRLIPERDHIRFAAYIRQAAQYYAAVADLDPVAKPLIAYYFALNLAKAYLTAINPPSTRGRIVHGLGEALDARARYSFHREGFKVQARGVFRLLAETTGQKFCYAAGYRVRVPDLLPYLPEAYDLYDVMDEIPKLLPIADMFVLFGARQGWLRIEIERDTLRQRALAPESVLKRARIFGTQFHLVTDPTRSTASYESNDRYAYRVKRSEILPYLSDIHEDSLIACHRTSGGGRRFIILSERTELLSHEAVTFAVLHPWGP